MNDRQLEYFRRKLIVWKQELLGQSAETIDNLQDSARSVPDLADRARRALQGHGGRIGLHGPFWGITIDTPDPDVRRIAQDRLEAALSALIRILDGKGGGDGDTPPHA